MSIRSQVATAVLVLVGLPVALGAQTDERLWAVNITGAAQLYAEASAIEAGPSVGIEALYRISPNLSIGPIAEFVRTTSDGAYFIAALNFGADSTRVFQVAQTLTALHYGALARFEISPGEKLSPYVTAGGGFYTLYLNGQANQAPKRLTAPLFQGGVGAAYAVSDVAGLQIEVRDIIYTDFDRTELNPILEANRNTKVDGSVLFPAAELQDAAAAESTSHNFRISVGFTYVPGLNR